MIDGFRKLFMGGALGKVLGIVREMLLAALLGTSAGVASYRVSQTAALAPMNLLNAELLAVGFLPQHARLADDPRLAWALYRMVRNWVLIACSVIAVGLVMFGRLWAGILAPGFSGDAVTLTVAMIAITGSALPFYGYVSVASYLAMARGEYRIAALRPSIQSLGLIAATIVAFATGSPAWLAVGFLAAYVGMSGWSWFVVHRLQSGAAALAAAEPGERRAVRIALWHAMRPYLVVPIVVQAVWVLERALTSLISVSAVAALDYARVISETIIVLVAAPLGLSVLASSVRGAHTVKEVARILLIFGVMVSGVIVVATPTLVTVVFGRGAFGPESVAVTSAFLLGLALGLWAQLVAYVLTRFLNAEGKNRMAALAVGIGSGVTVVADIILFVPLGPLGIGLGSSLGGMAQMIVVVVVLRVSRMLLSTAAMLAPPFVACVAIAFTVDGSPAARALWAAGVLALWAVWVVGIAPLRRATLDACRRLLGRHVSHTRSVKGSAGG
ncbi:lipid II flippase MurJ [Microbacterium sp.]|uniref:lipid II flippase MurJ n=2 Tax=unclassified Microbacterium TaxID=2609290 RepID=UPI0025CF9061|nr:lipid II flippase MurJ [Microbacterium sp.]